MRKALITGGSRGIGLAIARHLAQTGLEVYITYAHDAAGAAAAVKKAQAEGLSIAALHCDAAAEADWKKLFQRGSELAESGVQILVHAAGFTRDRLLMTMPTADLDAVLGVHLRGGFLAAKAVLPGMIAARAGRIVFLSSPTATLGRRGQTAYGAAKAGLLGLMRSLLLEVSRFGITVNCVSSGLVDTAIFSELADALKTELRNTVPMQRLGSADEIAALVGFLTSERGSYITGQSLAADGGLELLSAPPEAW